MPIPVNSYSFPIPCGWLIPTYSAKPTSAIPSACSTLARMNTGVAATSDVNPGRNQDVLDVERVPQRHLDEHAGHRDQQKSRDTEAHRSPLLQNLAAAAGKRRPWIARRPRSYPEIQRRVADDEVAAYQEQSEQRRREVVAEAEHVRQIDVGQRLDQVRI